MYTEQDIFKELDETYDKFFLDLGHGYFWTAGSRITLFADESRWAVVLEKSGYGNRSYNIEIDMVYYGNCLVNTNKLDKVGDTHTNAIRFLLVPKKSLDEVGAGFELLDPKSSFIIVRGNKLAIEHDTGAYAAKGINIRSHNNPLNLIDFVSLTRYLDEQYPELFRASESEIRTCLPADLPKIMVIDKWHHKPYNDYDDSTLGNKPSSYETFRLIAKILVTKDTTLWKPTLPANNDWRNWPEAGSL
jgi:hypothetical protein